VSVIASNSAGKISFDVGELKSLARAIKASRNMRVRVGLFPNNSARLEASKDTKKRTKEGAREVVKGSTSVMTAPELGAIHEFGSKTRGVGPSIFGHFAMHQAGPIPARSWLRMPIMLYLRPLVEGKGRSYWRSALSTKGMHFTLKKLGMCAKEVIQNAFETGGFGHWAKLKKATIKAKGSSAILIDTAQLRKAVASKVVRT